MADDQINKEIILYTGRELEYSDTDNHTGVRMATK